MFASSTSTFQLGHFMQVGGGGSVEAMLIVFDIAWCRRRIVLCIQGREVSTADGPHSQIGVMIEGFERGQCGCWSGEGGEFRQPSRGTRVRAKQSVLDPEDWQLTSAVAMDKAAKAGCWRHFAAPRHQSVTRVEHCSCSARRLLVMRRTRLRMRGERINKPILDTYRVYSDPELCMMSVCIVPG